MRSQRHKDLLRILHQGTAASQKEIVKALRSAGHGVTQATVSRDLQAIGATRVRSNGNFVYMLPDDVPRGLGGGARDMNLAKTLEEFAIEVMAAASIVLVKTAPGHASAVARAIDLATVPEVVGTVAGDDTIFVATASERDANEVARRWSGRGPHGYDDGGA